MSLNGAETGGGKLSAVGWEKNPQGKLGARVADLMDPTKCVSDLSYFLHHQPLPQTSEAVNLNLKVMRWQILQSLDLDKIAQTRCLLLSMGTLGCYVARTLMVCRPPPPPIYQY